MRNSIIGFIAGVLAAQFFVSSAGADADTLREDRTLRNLDRVAAALEKTENTQQAQVRVQQDLVRAVREVAGRCK